MSSEIATWGMIRAKVPAFPAPTAGRENECLTKAEILATGGARVTGSYGDNECPVIDDVLPNVTTQYNSITLTPASHTWAKSSTITFNFIVKCSLNTYLNGELISSVDAPWELGTVGGRDPNHFSCRVTNGVLAVRPVSANTGTRSYTAVLVVRPKGNSALMESAQLEHRNT